MIAWLSGIVRVVASDHVVLDVQGVGYEVFVHERDVERAREDQPLVLHIRMTVREDALTLFGFSHRSDRDVYDALTNVPGVGPKAAMALLSALTPGQLASAIHRQNAAELTKAKGVGKKLADLILLKLKDKLLIALEDITAPPQKAKPGEDAVATEVLSALQNLGYRPNVAHDAVTQARALSPTANFDALLRVALASLRKPAS
jgi:Holliday junction DNA helicase RuvA